jgi:hypothetical protein
LPETYSSKIRTTTCRDRVGLQPVHPDAQGGLRWVGVGTGVSQPVPEGRTAAEEPALGGGLGGHGAPNPGPDAGALALAHAAEERHQHVVGLRAGIDPPADLRDPQLDPVVLEQREGQGKLRAVEGTLRLSDGYGLKASVRGAQELEEPRGLGPAFPGEGPGLPDVEELGHDLAAAGLDELKGPAKLPGPRGGRILLVLGRDPSVEGEGLHDLLLLPATGSRDSGAGVPIRVGLHATRESCHLESPPDRRDEPRSGSPAGSMRFWR